jgi:hypothetical protein
MIVVATKVDALPIGLILPLKYNPNTTGHQGDESLDSLRFANILASMADKGILSVTELNNDEVSNRAAVPKLLVPSPIIR